MGVEQTFRIHLEPRAVYFGFLDDGKVARCLGKLRVNGWSEEEALRAVEDARRGGDRGNLHLYYALAWGDMNGLEGVDLYSMASLLSYAISGYYGGFGTENYEKERKVEKRWIYLFNRLVECMCDPLTTARIAALFIVSQYRRKI